MALNTQVAPPAWLTAIAKPADISGTGYALGTLLSGGLLGATQPDTDFTKDPDTGEWVNKDTGEVRETQPKLGFQKGLAEARMNQQDPMWKLREQEQKQRLLNQMASLELQHAQLKFQNDEKSAWLQDVRSGLPKWLSSDPKWRQEHSSERPTPTSRQGLALMSAKDVADQNFMLKDQLAKNAQQYKETQLENAKTRLEQEQWKAEHGTAWQQHQQLLEEGLSSSDDVTRAAVDKLPNKGRDPKLGFLTPEAEVIVNGYRKAHGELPIGAKPASAKGMSALGKLESERQAAIDSGAGEDVIADYDSAINKIKSYKPPTAASLLEHAKTLREAGDTESADQLEAIVKKMGTGAKPAVDKSKEKEINRIQTEINKADAKIAGLSGSAKKTAMASRDALMRQLFSLQSAATATTATTAPKTTAAAAAVSSETGHDEEADLAAKGAATTKTLSKADIDEAIRLANDAIAKGADKEAVKKRLKDAGIQIKD